jgi:hypothetical protein
VPLADRQRLATAAHLALQAMLTDAPQAAWLDLPAAVSVAAKLLDGRDIDDDALCALNRVSAALVDTAGLPTPTNEAKAACKAFLPYFEQLLACVTWRRLIDAQDATRAAWKRWGTTSAPLH